MYQDKELSSLKKFIDKSIKEAFSQENKGIQKIARYATFGGKRIRPILFFATLKAFKKDHKDFLNVGLAIELIHNSGLVYDDLPYIDNDDFRRGQLSVHKKFGKGPAILVGNWLLNYAFKLIINQQKLNTQIKQKLIKEMQQCTQTMIEGQLKELKLREKNKSLSSEKLYNLYKEKTASLFVLSVKLGSIIGKCSKEEKEFLEKFATHLGIAFQLADDLQEYKQRIFKDKEFNYAVLYGEKTTETAVKKQINYSLKILNRLKNIEMLKKIVFFIKGFALNNNF
jgi:geranylgeranyl pyrophosphate synthase